MAVTQLRWMHAHGDSFEAQQKKAHASDLYKHGDMILVWVNEGDLITLPNTQFPAPIESD